MEHESGVTCCAVSCDGSQVAAGTVEGDVCLWDVSSCYLLRQQPGQCSEGSCKNMSCEI